MWKNTTVMRDESGEIYYKSDYQTVKQRKEYGRSIRETVPRESHSQLEPLPDRRNPIDLLEESNQGRLPHLIPIRFYRMLQSPFTFYRGAASIMAYDLSHTPRSDIIVQACGDCHLSNFGLFATPERNLIFDLNDFDETHPASFEWDLKRLAASFYIACKTKKFSEKECKQIVATNVAMYREAIQSFSTMKILDIWNLRIRIEDMIAAADNKSIRRKREKMAEKARKKVVEYVFPKITEYVNGRWKIIDQQPIIYHPTYVEGMSNGILDMFGKYVKSLNDDRQFFLDRYRIEDIVTRVVGVGSVGTRCGVILLIGENEGPLFIQIKEGRQSVLEPYTSPNKYTHHGERIVQGQRHMQSASDAFLGWTTDMEGIQYYLRQYRDMKYSWDVDLMGYEEMINYAEGCGWTLARAHARAGDAAKIAGYIGKSDLFDEAITSFAKKYERQNYHDYLELVNAEKTGLITIEEG